MFLYNNNELSKRESQKKKSCLKSHQKEYLGIKLTKEVKDLCSEKYKTLMKETEEDSKPEKKK